MFCRQFQELTVSQLSDLQSLQYATSLVSKAVLRAVQRQDCGTEWLLFYLPIQLCLLAAGIIIIVVLISLRICSANVSHNHVY